MREYSILWSEGTREPNPRKHTLENLLALIEKLLEEGFERVPLTLDANGDYQCACDMGKDMQTIIKGTHLVDPFMEKSEYHHVLTCRKQTDWFGTSEHEQRTSDPKNKVPGDTWKNIFWPRCRVHRLGPKDGFTRISQHATKNARAASKDQTDRQNQTLTRVLDTKSGASKYPTEDNKVGAIIHTTWTEPNQRE